MPETISNTQTQQLTTTDNGRNVMPVLISDSHFFIESVGQNSFSQNNNQKFGAISTSQFRTTSKITFSGIKKIYAICQGQTFIVPQEGNPNKINLILRPYKQPIPELSIKYFVYRGLNKSDFFDSANSSISTFVASLIPLLRFLPKSSIHFFNASKNSSNKGFRFLAFSFI